MQQATQKLIKLFAQSSYFAEDVAASWGSRFLVRDCKLIDRRRFFVSAIAAGLAGLAAPAIAHKKGEPFILPDEYLPREVKLKTKLAPGEVHVDPNQYALFWTLPNNKAMRFTVGIGRGNLYHPGTFHVGAKQEWPRWIPTDDMKKRDPSHYQKFVEGGVYENGQPGGISNPLGARALYLYSSTGRDTYLRIHGTSDPRTIGIPVSNGCARLINPHVEQLYDLVPLNTRVVLYAKAGTGPAHSTIPDTHLDQNS
jgi:lipoprotein-anchoring transpeptidase ErfK/SrfK